MSEELIQAVREAGVVGAGGAGFPTDIKINAQVDTVIVNGSECEPLIQVDQQLMAEETEDLVAGLKTVIEITGAKQGIIGLKARYYRAIRSLEQVLPSGNTKIKIHCLEDFYPAGDEQILVYETTGRIIPEGEIPLKVKTVVINVETLINVARAVKGMPVVDKYLTVTGAVKNPYTGKLPLGISMAEAINLAGGPLIEDFVVISGGPMMGFVEKDLSRPVIKTTKGLIILPAEHSLALAKNKELKKTIRHARDYCCQCVSCTDLCPRYLLGHNLEPHLIMRALGQGNIDYKSVSMAQLCCECGVCEVFSCPMGLSPCNVNREIKKQLMIAGVKPSFIGRPDKVRSARSYRQIPENRLVARLGLTAYETSAPLLDISYRPKKVTLPLMQHLGLPAEPVVKTGDLVSRGQLVAARKAQGLGSNIHSSVTGRVIKTDSEQLVIEVH